MQVSNTNIDAFYVCTACDCMHRIVAVRKGNAVEYVKERCIHPCCCEQK